MLNHSRFPTTPTNRLLIAGVVQRASLAAAAPKHFTPTTQTNGTAKTGSGSAAAGEAD